MFEEPLALNFRKICSRNFIILLQSKTVLVKRFIRKVQGLQFSARRLEIFLVDPVAQQSSRITKFLFESELLDRVSFGLSLHKCVPKPPNIHANVSRKLEYCKTHLLIHFLCLSNATVQNLSHNVGGYYSSNRPRRMANVQSLKVFQLFEEFRI